MFHAFQKVWLKCSALPLGITICSETVKKGLGQPNPSSRPRHGRMGGTNHRPNFRLNVIRPSNFFLWLMYRVMEWLCYTIKFDFYCIFITKSYCDLFMLLVWHITFSLIKIECLWVNLIFMQMVSDILDSSIFLSGLIHILSRYQLHS